MNEGMNNFMFSEEMWILCRTSVADYVVFRETSEQAAHSVIWEIL